MQGDNESMPFKQIEILCKMFGVPFHVYNVTLSLDNIIAKIKAGGQPWPFPTGNK